MKHRQDTGTNTLTYLLLCFCFSKGAVTNKTCGHYITQKSCRASFRQWQKQFSASYFTSRVQAKPRFNHLSA